MEQTFFNLVIIVLVLKFLKFSILAGTGCQQQSKPDMVIQLKSKLVFLALTNVYLAKIIIYSKVAQRNSVLKDTSDCAPSI